MLTKPYWNMSWPTRLGRASLMGLFLTATSLLFNASVAHASNNFTLSGTFLTNSGTVPGIYQVQLSQNGQVVATSSAINQTTGAYSITVPAGDYTVGFTNNFPDAPPSTAPPGVFQCTSPCGNNVDLSSSNQTLNFTMPLAQVTITLDDQFGQPLSSAPVAAIGTGTLSMGSAGSFTGVSMGLLSSFNLYNVKTNAAGIATVYLPEGLMYAHVYAYPTAGGRVDYQALGNLTQNTSITMQQLPPNVYSGTVYGANSNPAYNVTIYLTDPYTNKGAHFTNTSTSGQFSLTVPADVYSLYYAYGPNSRNTAFMPPAGISATANASLPSVDLSTGSANVALTFNLVPITVNVVTSNGSALPNAGVTAAGSGPVEIDPLGQITSTMNASKSYGSLPQSNSAGQAVMYLPLGMNVTSVSACVSNLPTCNLFTNNISFTVTDPTTITVQQPPQNTFSGTFLDALGQPVANAFLTLAGGGLTWNFQTDSQGQYSENVNPGVYALQLNYTRTASTSLSAGLPPSQVYTNGNTATVDLSSSNVSENVNLNEAVLSVTVKDVNGNPLANSAVTANGTGNINMLPGETSSGGVDGGPTYIANTITNITPTTNSQGVVQLYLPIGLSYTLTAYQPETHANQNLATIASTTTSTVTANESLTLQQTYSYSGILTDSQGNAIQGAVVTLSSGTGLNYSGTTGSNGSFTINSTAGNFTLSVSADSKNSSLSTAPPGVFSSGPGPTVDMTANMIQNLTLPDAPVTLTVLDRYGHAAPNIPVSVTGSGPTNLYTGGGFSSATMTPGASLPKTNSSGQVVLYLPTGFNYSAVTGTFANDSATGTINQLSGTSSLTIQEPYTLSGTVKDSTGNPVNGAQVIVKDPTTGLEDAIGTTNPLGYYFMPLALGTYNVAIVPPTGSNLAGTTFSNYTTTDDATLNATLQPAFSVLTGRVVNGANIGIANVQVQVVSQSDHTDVLASATTDSGGYYTASVAPGTYDVLVTPSGSTYLPTSQSGVDLTSNATLDFDLVLAPNTFSGHVYDRNNLALPNVTITLLNSGNQTYTTTTNTNGFFSLPVNPAAYTLTISGTSASTNLPAAVLPTTFNITGGAVDLSSSNVTQNLTINAFTETFTTTNSLTGAAENQVTLSVSASSQTTLFSGSSNYSDSETFNGTEPSGSNQLSVTMLGCTAYSVTATPQAGADVVTTSFPSSGQVCQDGSATLPLNAVTSTFSGNLTDSANGNTGISGATISLGQFKSQLTDNNGYFSVLAPRSAFALSVVGSGDSVNLPGSFSLSNPSIDLSQGNVTQNLSLTPTTIEVSTEDPAGNPISNVPVTLTCSGSTSLFGSTTSTGSSSSHSNSGPSGQIGLSEVSGFSNCGYTASSVSGFQTTTGSFTSTGTIVITMTRQVANYTASVTDQNGTPLYGALVTLTGPESDEIYSHRTEPDGSVTIPVALVNYQVSVSGDSTTTTDSPTAYIPQNFKLGGSETVSSDASQTFVVDAVTLTIQSRKHTNNIVQVPNVAIDFGSSGTQNGLSASSTGIQTNTGSGASVPVVMLADTTYTIAATPPTSSGYPTTTFNGTSPVTASGDAVIEFQGSTVTANVANYTANTGSFMRSPTPFTTGVSTQSENSDGSVTVSVNNAPGYADSGFYLYKTTLGNLPNFTVYSSSGDFGLNLWFDNAILGDFFQWNSNGVLTGLGGDTYGLSSGSTNGSLSVNGNTSFFMMDDGQNYTLSQLIAGDDATSGINANTPVTVWVGVDVGNGGSTSATISAINGLY